MNPRTGRPRLPDEQRRSITFKIRMTAAENELIRLAGGSEWARATLLRMARRQTRDLPQQQTR